MEYQLWEIKPNLAVTSNIRMIFVWKWPGLIKMLMPKMAKLGFSRSFYCVKNCLDFSENQFLLKAYWIKGAIWVSTCLNTWKFPLCNENLNSFLTWWVNYSREETIWGNMVPKIDTPQPKSCNFVIVRLKKMNGLKVAW